MNLRIAIFLVFTGIGFTTSAFAQNEPQPETYETDCASYPDIPVTLTPRFDNPVYNFSTGIAGIQALASDTRHSIHENLTLGLTRYEPMLEFRVPVKQITFPDGSSCAHIEHVDVDFGYSNVVVYVAAEIPQGSCGFTEIMAHEQKHIDVNRAILEEYTPYIEQQLKNFLSNYGVLRERNLDYATQLLKQNMHQVLMQLIDQVVEDNQRRQQAVDSPEEYRRITYACNGQLAQIAQRFKTGR